MTPVHTIVQITDLHLVADGVLLRHRLDTADALARALAAVQASRVTPAGSSRSTAPSPAGRRAT